MRVDEESGIYLEFESRFCLLERFRIMRASASFDRAALSTRNGSPKA